MPACLPMCPIHKIHYNYFVALGLVLGSPYMYLSKPLCLRSCPYALFTKSTIPFFLAVCLVFWSPNLYLPQPLCLRACSYAPFTKSIIPILCRFALSWEALICICQNHYAGYRILSSGLMGRHAGTVVLTNANLGSPMSGMRPQNTYTGFCHRGS